MATFYPDLANIDRLTVSPTDGERHLLSVLRDKLDDSYEVSVAVEKRLKMAVERGFG